MDNKKDISFWNDRWLDCGILKYLFSQLHVLSHNPASRIAEMGYWNNGVWSWNLGKDNNALLNYIKSACFFQIWKELNCISNMKIKRFGILIEVGITRSSYAATFWTEFFIQVYLLSILSFMERYSTTKN